MAMTTTPKPSRKSAPQTKAQPARMPAPRLARNERMDEILIAARDIFCELGYEQTAVATIAARIGVVEGTVFKYFATKRELLLKVLERWYDDISSALARDLDGLATPRERLRAVIHSHLRVVRDYPLLCRLMFREVRGEEDYRSSTLHEKNRRYTRFLTEVIKDGSSRGAFRAGISPTLARDLVYGGIEHLSWNYVCGRGGLDIEQIADTLTAMVCDGIATPAVRTAAPRKNPARGRA